jgi:hypothetical protein
MNLSSSRVVERAARFGIVVTPVLALLTAIVYGTYASLGLAMGGALATGSLWLSNFIVRSTLRRDSHGWQSHFALQILMLLKLPLFMLIALALMRLGMASAIGFISGYALVYSALVVGAVLERSAPARCDKEA